MSEPVIKVEGLYKKFCLSLKRSMAYAAMDVSRSMVGIPYRTDTLRRDEFWALQDINFELNKGDTLGIIGINGSGKSTLLRLLTGIFPPDKGSVAVKGQIGALIAVGAGFHPHMTGRENIYLNGTILGMNRKQIDEKFDEIVDFADIGDFIDAPVTTYSSGMKVRLGFSVAVNVEPEILLVDEILSVGDLSFRNKSLRRMREYREKANALIFISHNLEQIQMLCNRLLVLNQGRIIYDGDTVGGILLYEEITRSIAKNTDNSNYKAIREDKDNIAKVNTIETFDDEGNNIDEIDISSPITVSVDFNTLEKIDDIVFMIGILDDASMKDCILLSSLDNKSFENQSIQPGSHKFSVRIDNPHLSPGLYYVQVALKNRFSGEYYVKARNNKPFKVNSSTGRIHRGIILVNEEWSLNENFIDNEYFQKK